MPDEMTQAEALLRRRFRLIDAGEVGALLSLYHDDAVLLRLDRAIRGRDALREHFAVWLARAPRLVELTALGATEDLAVYHATVAEAGGEPRPVHGTIGLRGERIVRETQAAFPELSGTGRTRQTVQVQLEPYESWQPAGPVPDPRSAGREAIGPILLAIIAAEGPVLAERAYRLFVKASGGKALTSIARAPLSGCAYRLRQAGVIELDEEAGLLRPTGGAAVRVRELGGRTLDEVPRSELVELMRRLRDAGVATADLPRAVLDAYGLVRMTSKAEALLAGAAPQSDRWAANRCYQLSTGRPPHRGVPAAASVRATIARVSAGSITSSSSNSWAALSTSAFS